MNVLVINGHPDKESFNYALAAAYQAGLASTDAAIACINIGELAFNPNLAHGYRLRMELEPDLLAAIQKIKEADHLVWVFPMWWYGYPAVMKGFVDRVFLPGIAFESVPGKSFPKKLLAGKTGRIIITADTPQWYDFAVMGRPTIKQFKKGTLEFCGISPVAVTFIAPVRDSGESFRSDWLAKVRKLGTQAK